MTYGGIVGGLAITDSGDACCDEITIIYDEVEDVVNDLGEVTSSTVERIQTRFWTEAHASNAGDRFRLYKRRTILGRNNAILGSPIEGAREVMADFIEDLQLNNSSGKEYIYTVEQNSFIHKYDTSNYKWVESFGVGYNSYPGPIDIGSDGQLYSVVQKNGKSSIQIVNLKTKNYTYIDSSGGNSRFAPGLAFLPDGYLYVNTSAGSSVDVYDISTKALVRSINNPDSSITNLTLPRSAVNSNGMVCKSPFGISYIQCTNPSMSMGHAGPYKTLKFDSQNRLYATSDGSRKDIDVFNSATGQYIKSIKVGIGGQNSRTQTVGIASLSNIKTVSTVDINLTLRAKNEYGKTNKQFLKKDYFSGNFNFNKNDLFKRDTFSTSVSVRNM
jgi:WD40 repeat protein